MAFFIITVLFALAYLFLQLYYLYHWLQIPEIEISEEYTPSTSFSIIIVARNEEKNIETCIKKIQEQNYPQHLFEIIIVDDRSTDKTAEIVSRISSPTVAYYRLSDNASYIHEPAYKKSGIELGVSKSKHQWIIQTDADTITEREWLQTIAYLLETEKAEFITAPVIVDGSDSLLVRMQEVENLVFMLITGAGISSRVHDIANGANMAYSKSVFQQVSGFEGNYHVPSGDDMFLIEKMRKFKTDAIHFAKSRTAVVHTHAKETWDDLIRQRIRWSGKNKYLENKMISYIWGFIGLYHLMVLAALVLAFFSNIYLMCFIILVLAKWIPDFLILNEAANFFEKRNLKKYFVILQFVYSYYILRLSVSLLVRKKGDW